MSEFPNFEIINSVIEKLIQNSKFKIQNSCETGILLVLFLLPFYFVKFKYSWVSLNLVEILIIALFLFWIFSKNTKYLPRRQAGQIPNTKYQIPVILIITGLFLSTIINRNYYVGVGVIKSWFVLPIIFAIILYDSLKKDEKLLNKIFIALFASGVLVSVEGVYYWLSGLLTYDGRLRVFFDSPNQLEMFLAVPFLVGICLISPRPNLGKIPRFGLGIGLVLIGFNLYLTKSYGAWVALGLTMTIVFWLKYRKIWSKKYLAIAIIIFIILITLAGFGKFESIKNLGERSSLASRVMIWKSAALMLKNNPLFGIGPGNFQAKYLEYQKYFPPYLEWAVPQPHNLFLAFWLEAGLMGLVGFVLLLVQFFRDNKKVIINNRLYGTLCLAIMLYFLVHGLIDTTYWRNDMAVVFWIVIAVNMCLAESLDLASRRSG